MWLKESLPALIVVLLAAVPLTGCKTDNSFNSPTDSSASNDAPTAAPWWKGRSPAASIQRTSSLTPTFDSASSSGVSRRQETGPARDPSVVRAVDTPASAKPGSGAYKIGPNDVLQISVFKVPELSQTVEVAETGTVNVPLVGDVPAAGNTARELEQDLTSKLGANYLKNPQVTVSIKDYKSQHVTLAGDIKTPGVYPLKDKTSLLQVVAMAGGFEESSDWTVLILRQSDGKRSAIKFDVSAIQNGRAEDPIVQAGDQIVAGSSAIKKGFGAILKALPIAGAATQRGGAVGAGQ